jgi:hypothetical protein
VASSLDYNANTFTSGPSNPFGTPTVISSQVSIYATYAPPAAPSARPSNTTAPSVSGTATAGQTLSANVGVWSEEPSEYSYQWQRCSSPGSCASIKGANGPTYPVGKGDVGSRLAVSVIATNAIGPSAAVVSAETAPVAEAGASQQLEYVLEDGLISVYDMDNAYKLVKTISLPQTVSGIRGVSVAVPQHLMLISYGPDETGSHGSVLAYNLVTEQVVWNVTLSTGIDSGAVSPDGTRLYEPTGENSSSGIWNILNTANGEVLGTIKGLGGAHNTVVSNNGRYVYLGNRATNYLGVYDTTTGEVRNIGPLFNDVRPFTVNGSNTLAFTTASELDGFQVSSITTGKVLFTVSAGAVPAGFPFSAPSHGIGITPNEHELYVIDSVNKEVRFYNIAKAAEGVEPTLAAVVPVAGLSGEEEMCAYDCTRGGWLQPSIDGRFVFVGDSGEVIEVATRKVVATLPTLLNTKKSIEVEFSGGVPVASSQRTGVGQVG